jgi:hypothetical protein
MTELISNEDQQWLDALAGQEVLDPALNAHAQSVRRALQQRRQEIEADAEQDRSTELAALRNRLQREGLMSGMAPQSKSWLQNLLTWVTLGSQPTRSSSGTSRTLNRVIPVVVFMAVAGGAVWLAMQGRAPQVDERLIYRGDPNVVSLLVNDPKQRANELATGLKAIPGIVTMQALKPNGWLLRVQDSDSVRDYLATQRIDAIAVNGQITLLVLHAENAKH